MDKGRLKDPLADAIRAIESREGPRIEIDILMHRADGEDKSADPQLVDLMRALRSESDLSIFNGNFIHIVPNGGQTVDYWHLGSWLVTRAKKIGADQALNELEKYLKAPVLPCEVAL